MFCSLMFIYIYVCEPFHCYTFTQMGHFMRIHMEVCLTVIHVYMIDTLIDFLSISISDLVSSCMIPTSQIMLPLKAAMK